MAAARIIFNEDWVHSILFGCGDWYFWGIFHVNISFESGFTGFIGLERTSSVWVCWSFVDCVLYTLLFADA